MSLSELVTGGAINCESAVLKRKDCTGLLLSPIGKKMCCNCFLLGGGGDFYKLNEIFRVE